MPEHADILLFVEDPGAANYAAGLPAALAALGRSAVLLAAGPAERYLRECGVPFTALPYGQGRDAALPSGADAAGVLSRWSPRLVAVGTSENPRTIGLGLIDAAADRGVPSAGLIDGYANAAHRFRGQGSSSLGHAPDWLIVPDDATSAAYAVLGFPASRIRACGHPHWDHVRAEAARYSREDRTALRARLFPGCARERPAWVFAAEISDGLDPAQYRRSAEYTLRGNPESSGRTEIVLDEFLAAVRRLPARPYLVLRLHPKNRREELRRYLDEFDGISSGGTPLELLYASDAVVGMTSMLLLEGVLSGRRTFSILPRPSERAWLSTIALGSTPCAGRREEVEKGLENLLVPGPPPPSGLPETRCAAAVAATLAGLARV